mmetsp:Transcript_25747/g.42524  ORF Transcript_25747/g.42524 Transcript_25747/m.42524 type:complete len:99 (-) Transcript_25747:23-319(-)
MIDERVPLCKVLMRDKRVKGMCSNGVGFGMRRSQAAMPMGTAATQPTKDAYLLERHIMQAGSAFASPSASAKEASSSLGALLESIQPVSTSFCEASLC